MPAEPTGNFIWPDRPIKFYLIATSSSNIQSIRYIHDLKLIYDTYTTKYMIYKIYIYDTKIANKHSLELGTRKPRVSYFVFRVSCFVFRVYRYKHENPKLKHETNTKKVETRNKHEKLKILHVLLDRFSILFPLP